MQPYYSDGQVTLYLGDSREIAAWLEADVLVTDPPYGIGWTKGTNKAAGSYRHTGIRNDRDTTTRDTTLNLWGDQRPSIVFGSFRAPPPRDVRQTLVWKKPVDAGVVGSTTGYRTDTELIYLRGPHIRRTSSRSSVLECGANTMHGYLNGHPHAKPVDLLGQLIEWTEGTIADPFAGSGSTLIAARDAGRHAIGVELEERYAEIAAKRLDRMVLL